MEENNSTYATCFACGESRARSAMRPFGHDASGNTLTWVCRSCAAPKVVEVMAGGPRLSWATIAKAQRLAHQRLGWSTDHVMRVALAHLEAQAKARAS